MGVGSSALVAVAVAGWLALHLRTPHQWCSPGVFTQLVDCLCVWCYIGRT